MFYTQFDTFTNFKKFKDLGFEIQTDNHHYQHFHIELHLVSFLAFICKLHYH